MIFSSNNKKQLNWCEFVSSEKCFITKKLELLNGLRGLIGLAVLKIKIIVNNKESFSKVTEFVFNRILFKKQSDI